MPASGFAIPTGAQFQDNEMVLNFDVLIIDPAIDYGSTYFASVVAIEPGDTPEEIRLKVTEQMLIDGFNQTGGIELQPQNLTIPAYFKGVVSPEFEYPTLEEPPAEEPPAEEPPAEEEPPV